ncbi:MAG: hypothetical protein KUG82_12065 [Pseudomonadales bacterium]|nr:hypothetical protein [Pseudomonadales bacterium]
MPAEISRIKLGVTVFFCGMVNVMASEVEAPSVEFLEYLGQFQEDDGQWLDPFEVDAMANATSKSISDDAVTLSEKRENSVRHGANTETERGSN